MFSHQLSAQELRRYSRQISLAEVGLSGQQKLKSASVLVIGVGGLGSPLALYLAAAGVGRIGLIDFDRVDVSNLHRQVLYSTHEVGLDKVECAARRLKELNPEIEIQTYSEKLSLQNAQRLFASYDIIADGADNFFARYLANDAAYFSNKPLVSASILGFEGQLAVFGGPGGSCYRCLYPEPPPAGTVPSCAEAGVLGVLPGVMGALQATEVIKLILNLPTLQSKPSLLLYDALAMTFTKLQISQRSECPLCGSHPSIHHLAEPIFVCEVPTQSSSPQLSVDELNAWMGTRLFQLLDVREPHELGISKLAFTHHIPLGELPQRLAELSRETPLVVYCRSGGRSQKACDLLLRSGFHCLNLQGGLLRWIENIDPSLTKY